MEAQNGQSSGIKPGKYLGRGKEWALGKASTGRVQIGVLFEVFTFAGEALGHLPWYGTFSEDALDLTVRAMRACGWTGATLTDLAGLDANDVELVVTREEYQGKAYTRIAFVNQPARLVMNNVMEPDAIAQAAAKLDAKIAALAK